MFLCGGGECEIIPILPGEDGWIEKRRMAHAEAYCAEHGEYPDALTDDALDRYDAWRAEYHAWYAAASDIDRRRDAMRVVP
jgi:hypothetical protein